MVQKISNPIHELSTSGHKDVKYADVTSETETDASGVKSTYYYLAGILGLLKFLSVNRDRPGVFVATYLLLAGWKESSIGQVMFIRSMISLFVQTPLGDLIDKSHHKREYVALACIGVSITGLSTVYFLDYIEVAVAMAFQGVFLALVAPAIYGLTLGLVGSERMAQQTSINEMCDHAGTVIFATFAGLLAYFYDDTIIFWVVFVMAIQTMLCLLMIRPHMIDHDRARGLASEDLQVNKDGQVIFSPVSYWDIFKDRNILVLLATVLMYHFGNAAMLPLLSQMLAIGNGRAGIPFTAACIVISQATMVPTASWIGSKVQSIGTKRIFLFGLCIIPIRGFAILVLMSIYPNRGLLLTTQVLDGLSSGIYAVLCVLVTEDLTRGSGRFNFVFGLVNTVHAVGDAFSNLAAQQIAYTAGYQSAFIMLSFVAVVPILLYAFGMKPRDRTLTLDGSRNGSSTHSNTASSAVAKNLEAGTRFDRTVDPKTTGNNDGSLNIVPLNVAPLNGGSRLAAARAARASHTGSSSGSAASSGSIASSSADGGLGPSGRRAHTPLSSALGANTNVSAASATGVAHPSHRNVKM